MPDALISKIERMIAIRSRACHNLLRASGEHMAIANAIDEYSREDTNERIDPTLFASRIDASS